MSAAPVPSPALHELVLRARDLGRFPIAYLSIIEGGIERLHVRLGLEAEHLPADSAFPFMAAEPMVGPEGRAVGRLGVADVIPRELTRAQRTGLANLAALAFARVEALRDAGSLSAPAGTTTWGGKS